MTSIHGGLGAYQNPNLVQRSAPAKRPVRPSEMLQQLQQQQAAPEQAIQQAPYQRQASTAPPPAASFAARYNRLNYEDVKQVASKAGFVGLSDSAIQRAYMLQESLLVDTKV